MKPRNVATLLLVGLLLWTVGCRREAASEGAQGVSVSKGSLNGIQWEVRGVGQIEQRTNNDEASVSVGSNRLEIKGGRLTVNGRAAGEVKPGDSILLDRDGQLTVNGQPR
jgi:hypothetical protein